MKRASRFAHCRFYICFLIVTIATSTPVRAHNLHGGGDKGYDRTVQPPAFEMIAARPFHWPVLADAPPLLPADDPPPLDFFGDDKLALAIAEAFRPFAKAVRVRWDDRFFYVESDGFPDHRLMVGITAWQQQVPIPQRYVGANAWRFPLVPAVAKSPLSAKNHFFRGAIAIAVNGVPIFNPIKNDGRTDTFLAGELDEFGGHAGRADDYHYHIAPLHLQKIVGDDKPLAFALDGYPIYGLTEPDGSTPVKLDIFNGHAGPNGGYHYHSSLKYPYVNGGFHGEVSEVDGQVDPQPRANGVRPATEPLRGAKIVGFSIAKDGVAELTYTIAGETRRIIYAPQRDGSWRFEFVDGKGTSIVENFSGVRTRRDDNAPRRENDGDKRTPWIVQHAAEMDSDRDGVLTVAELTAETEKTFRLYDSNRNGKIDASELSDGNVRSAMGGFVKQHSSEIDANSDSVINIDELSAVVKRMFGKADRDRNGKLTKDETAAATLSERSRKN